MPHGRHAVPAHEVYQQGAESTAQASRSGARSSSAPLRGCTRETQTHGGNTHAFWSQCDQCKWHISYYPTSAPGMEVVQTKLCCWREYEKKMKREQRAKRASKASAKGKPLLEKGKTDMPASPRAVSRETTEWEAVEELIPRTEAIRALALLETAPGANPVTSQLIHQMRGHLGAEGATSGTI